MSAADNDWLEADYAGYRRWFDDTQAAGGIPGESSPFTFDRWLASQPPRYREAHGAS